MAIRPVYSKLVLPSRKSLEIIINIKIKIKNNKNNKIIIKLGKRNVGCPLIRACSLIRSYTVYVPCIPACLLTIIYYILLYTVLSYRHEYNGV